jgi:NADPH:quinone reductase-like Zn-dependent oxidoreductase
MKAMVFEEFGGPEVLHEVELDVPEPGPGQVRVKVRAAGVNLLDSKMRSAPNPAFPVSFPALVGFDVAGTVDAVGPDVEDVAVGDEVFGFADGGAYAEYALATTVAPRPEGLDPEHAAAIPVAGETSTRVLGQLGVGQGDTVLIHGGAGSVGQVAVQLAVARGATVIATASEANHAYLEELGAIPVVYGDGLVERVQAAAPQGVDAVFDVAGKGAIEDSITLRGGTDRIITIADPTAPKHGVPFSPGGPRDPEVLADLAGRAAAGELTLALAGVYPLADVARAHAQLDTGHGRGKIVLTVG